MLLLDEPAAGMNPQETNELKDLVLQIRADRDLSILLIEHDMGMVMSLSDRIYVMEYGSRIAAGTPAEVRSNPARHSGLSGRKRRCLKSRALIPTTATSRPCATFPCAWMTARS